MCQLSYVCQIIMNYDLYTHQLAELIIYSALRNLIEELGALTRGW